MKAFNSISILESPVKYIRHVRRQTVSVRKQVSFQRESISRPAFLSFRKLDILRRSQQVSLAISSICAEDNV